MSRNLTTANATVVVSIEKVFPQPRQIQGYAADDFFDFENVENGEYSMGIDGKLSAGFVFNSIPWSLTLQANSPSLPIFDQLWLYEVSHRDKCQIDATVTIPGLGKRFDLKEGFMRAFNPPSGKKIMQPAVIEFVFSRLSISPI